MGHAQKICFVSTMTADHLIGCFLEISSRGGTTNYPSWDYLERAPTKR